MNKSESTSMTSLELSCLAGCTNHGDQKLAAMQTRARVIGFDRLFYPQRGCCIYSAVFYVGYTNDWDTSNNRRAWLNNAV